MPTAGEEGYETLVICPYDKSHEIRRGRMQFHLEKCRKNHPDVKITCPFNRTHMIYKQEEEYHKEFECESRKNWDIYTHEIKNKDNEVICPVKDLVKVNEYELPDCDENWDNYQADGSVLNIIKAEATEKNIFRMMQCESKAKRKEFRRKEALRHGSMDVKPSYCEENPPVEVDSVPAARPKRATSIPVQRKQNPEEAKALLNKQFLNLDISGRDVNSIKFIDPRAETSSTRNTHVSSPVACSSASLLSENSFALAASSSTPLSFASAASRTRSDVDTTNTGNTRSRPSTAMNIVKSTKNVNIERKPLEENFPDQIIRKPFEEDTFCQMPIPGGRGRGRVAKNY